MQCSECIMYATRKKVEECIIYALALALYNDKLTKNMSLPFEVVVYFSKIFRDLFLF